MKSIASFLVIIVVATGVVINAVGPITTVLGRSSNLYYYSSLVSVCNPIEQDYNQNKIVLRIDDIQADAWNNVQVKMIKETLQRDIPMSLGVIPNGLTDDKQIYYLLKNNICNLGLALHGWDHGAESKGEIPEFGKLTKEEAKNRIVRGKEVLRKLSGVSPTTFIPPSNFYSLGTKKALEDIGFEIISSEGNGYFDYNAATYDFNTNSLVPVEQVVADCQAGLDRKKLCIVMIHPKDYTSDDKFDQQKYQMYLDLLVELNQLDAAFVKMEDVLNQFTPTPVNNSDTKVSIEQYQYSPVNVFEVINEYISGLIFIKKI